MKTSSFGSLNANAAIAIASAANLWAEELRRLRKDSREDARKIFSAMTQRERHAASGWLLEMSAAIASDDALRRLGQLPHPVESEATETLDAARRLVQLMASQLDDEQLNGVVSEYAAAFPAKPVPATLLPKRRPK